MQQLQKFCVDQTDRKLEYRFHEHQAAVERNE